MTNINNRSRLIRIIYALCLAGATCNHVRFVMANGLNFDYGGLPLTLAQQLRGNLN